MSYRVPGQEQLETKVGSTRPTFRQVGKGKNWFFRFLARCENLAAWFFFLFNNVALFRFSLEFLAATVIIYGALGACRI